MASLYNKIIKPFIPTTKFNFSDDTLFYHYTSTYNANQIKLYGRIFKKSKGVLLTTLTPENNSREEILRNNYGSALRDAHKNKADYCVVIVPHNLNMNKLHKADDIRDVYRYQADIEVKDHQVMDKPRCENVRKIRKTENHNKINHNSASNSNINVDPKISSEYIIKLHLRNDIIFEDKSNSFYQDSSVIIMAPAWAEQAMNILMTKIDKQLTCQIYSNNMLKYKFTIGRQLSLKLLVQIARNESFNTGGKINFNNYDIQLSRSFVFSLKDLVRQCVIVGSDTSSYNDRSNSMPTNTKVYICDLIGLQFQQMYNTGRLILIGRDIPSGYLDELIFTNVVGESKISYEEAVSDETGRYQRHQDVYFDQMAYIQFVANDVLISGLALDKFASEDINFKFLKYGTGYFAGPFKNILDTLIYEGVAEGLQKLLPKSKHIKAIELPFYEYSEKIKKICDENNVFVKFSKDDALKPSHPHLPTATTNCADPHAITGNKMGYSSVDGAIAENLTKRAKNFSPIINQSIKEQFIEL